MRFLVAGIGASAGGLEAMTELLRAIPKSTGIAFIVVQHMDPHHNAADIERRRTFAYDGP